MWGIECQVAISCREGGTTFSATPRARNSVVADNYDGKKVEPKQNNVLALSQLCNYSSYSFACFQAVGTHGSRRQVCGSLYNGYHQNGIC